MAFSRALLLKGIAGVTAISVGSLGVVFREEIGDLFKSKEQLEKDRVERARKAINKMLETLGLEDDCRLDDSANPSSFSKLCDLDEGKLKKIKFSNKGEGELIIKTSGAFPSDLKIKIEGTKEGITFSFTGLTTEIKLFGDGSKGKIVIKGEEQKFKVEGGKLTKENRNPAIEKLNEQLGKVNAPLECRFDEAETEASVECPITQDDLKGLEFSNKGERDLTIKDWPSSGAENIKLKVEKDDQNAMSLSFTGITSDIRVFGDKSKGKIVLKSSTPEQKFTVVDGKLTKGTPKEEIGEFNRQLGDLNAPFECRFDESETEESVECNISEDEFKDLNFSNKGEGKLKVVGWPSEGNIKLKVKKETAPSSAISLSFTGITSGSDIKVFGDKSKGKIVIKAATPETKFKVEEGRLTKESSTVDSNLKELNKQLGSLNVPLECRFDETETDGSVECPITQGDLKLMEFSNRGTGELKVKDWSTNTGVKLKVEKESAPQNTMSLSFTGVTSDIKVVGNEGKIVIKSSNGNNKKFKVENGKLTKESTGVDATLKTKLEEFNKQLGSVNAPLECRFDEIEGETTAECSVTPEELKKMVFSKDQGKVTYSEGDDFTEMKLMLKTHEEITHSGHGEADRVMYLIFKGYNKTVKLMDGGEELVSLIKGTNPEFGIYKGSNGSEKLVMEKMWGLGYIWTTLGLQNCTIQDDKTQGECNFDPTVKTVKVAKGSSDQFEELTVTDTNNNKLELHKDAQDFNQGYKFVFRGTKVQGKESSDICLEPDNSYEFKWKLKDKTKAGYLSKKNSQ